MAAPVKVARQQATPELSGTFRTLPPEPIHQHAPELSGTFRNSPEPSTIFRNPHQHTPEPSGTFRNLPPEPTPAHTGTLRNLPSEPAPATRTGTHRSLSGLKTPVAHAVGEKVRDSHHTTITTWLDSQKCPRYASHPRCSWCVLMPSLHPNGPKRIQFQGCQKKLCFSLFFCFSTIKTFKITSKTIINFKNIQDQQKRWIVFKMVVSFKNDAQIWMRQHQQPPTSNTEKRSPEHRKTPRNSLQAESLAPVHPGCWAAPKRRVHARCSPPGEPWEPDHKQNDNY